MGIYLPKQLELCDPRDGSLTETATNVSSHLKVPIYFNGYIKTNSIKTITVYR